MHEKIITVPAITVYNTLMSLILSPNKKPLRLQLQRDLVRAVKRGHAWVYADALRILPEAPPGMRAVLLDNRGGREIGRGFYDPNGPIALRICTTQREEALTEAWAESRMRRALELRQPLFDETTTGYRLFNGEGDGLPGLVCDRYGDHAVLSLDGEAASAFWDADGIAAWLAETLELKCVYQRPRRREDSPGTALFGGMPTKPVPFLENGVRFTADLLHGQKTGFYLDQRQNRARVGALADGRRVLNVFGYTGGFSVYAGLGGAIHVTTVDTAKPALEVAVQHWTLNDLPKNQHETIPADAFDYLASAVRKGQSWDMVILDPPSFAPSKDAVPKALSAYRKLIADGAAVTAPGGILAAGSCSSHVSMPDFLQACEEGISQARRKAATLGIHTQPPDHPAPLAMPEYRYLKFVIMRVEK